MRNAECGIWSPRSQFGGHPKGSVFLQLCGKNTWSDYSSQRKVFPFRILHSAFLSVFVANELQ